MNTVTRHIVEGLPTSLTVTVKDEPGHAGANHRYEITGFDIDSNPSKEDFGTHCERAERMVVLFQNGVVPEVGQNGVTLEALLSVCEHRLQGFQSGQFACEENQEALDHISKAIDALKGRTAARLARDVEGKHIQ